MATLTVQSPGAILTQQAASAGGDVFTNTAKTLLIVNNTSGAGRTVTVAIVRQTAQVKGFGTAIFLPVSLVMASNGIATVQLPPAAYNDATGKVSLSVNTATGVTYSVVKLDDI